MSSSGVPFASGNAQKRPQSSTIEPRREDEFTDDIRVLMLDDRRSPLSGGVPTTGEPMLPFLEEPLIAAICPFNIGNIGICKELY